MRRWLHWLQAARPLAQANIAIPLLFGQAVAWHVHQAFDPAMLAFCLLWGVLDQLLIVFANDYADRDSDTTERTLFSGGSGVLVEGKITPGALLRAAQISALALGVLSIALAAIGRPWTLVGWIGAMALIYAYSYEPLNLSRRGYGEWLQGIGIGIALPWLGFYLQSGSLALPWWAWLAPLLLGVGGNITTSVPDIDNDRAADKRSLPVRVGERRGRVIGILYLLAAIAIAAYHHHPLLLLCGVPLVGSLASTFASHFAQPRARIAYVLGNGLAINGLLVSWGYWLIAA